MANEVRLIEAPVGLFRHGDVLGFKTEYFLNGHVEAYVVESGELFYGGTETAQELDNLLVTPVDPSDLRPKGRWEKHWCDTELIGHMYEVCPNCRSCEILDTDKFWDSNYCPNCGTKMEG